MENLNDIERARLEKLEKQRKKQLARQNNYIKNNYDRIAFVIPKGQKDIIAARAAALGFKNIADYIKELITSDLKKDQ